MLGLRPMAARTHPHTRTGKAEIVMTLIESQICRRGLLLIMGLILPALLNAPALAQDHAPQTPDSQQMQRKLDELENEIRELRQQISTQQTNTQQTNTPAELPSPNRQPSEGNVPSPSDHETEQPEQVAKPGTIYQPYPLETQHAVPRRCCYARNTSSRRRGRVAEREERHL